MRTNCCYGSNTHTSLPPLQASMYHSWSSPWPPSPPPPSELLGHVPLPHTQQLAGSAFGISGPMSPRSTRLPQWVEHHLGDTHVQQIYSCSQIPDFICLPVCLFAHLSVCLSACLSVCLSVCMSTCLSIPFFLLASLQLSLRSL